MRDDLLREVLVAPRRSRDEWAELVAEFEAGSVTLDAFAAMHGLNRNTLAWWRSRLRTDLAPTTGDFVPVVVDGVAPCRLSVDAELPNGVVLRFRDRLDPAQLRTLVATLASA